MKKQSSIAANVGDSTGIMTRSRAATLALQSSGFVASSRAPSVQTRKRVLRENPKKAASDENNIIVTDNPCRQHKRRAVLQDVTNVFCENSYQSFFHAAKIQPKNSKQAKNGQAQISKVAPWVSVKVQHVQANSKTRINKRTVKAGHKPVELSTSLGCTSGGLGMFLLIGAWWLFKFVKRRREIKLKQKFFKRNGGILLQQELASTEGTIEKTKLFTSKELERATDNFNFNRILGQGGQGTVYKRMLPDGKIVDVKMSKVIDESEVEEFINEMVILSQINHRNVVKLLDCCLETEVPLLVYEFIPNGTLFEYIHNQNEDFPITWEMRLRIAIEVSGALSCLGTKNLTQNARS